jgi:hypothetical protein
MTTYRITAISLTLFLAMLLIVTPVLAGTPHISKAKATGPDAAGNLTGSFTVSGLSEYNWAFVGITGVSESVYACKPAEGNFLPNPVAQVISSSFDIHDNLTPTKGSVTGDSLITSPETDLTCDEGMNATLAMITYSNLELQTTYYEGQWPMYATKSINGTFSATYYGYKP